MNGDREEKRNVNYEGEKERSRPGCQTRLICDLFCLVKQSKEDERNKKREVA